MSDVPDASDRQRGKQQFHRTGGIRQPPLPIHGGHILNAEIRMLRSVHYHALPMIECHPHPYENQKGRIAPGRKTGHLIDRIDRQA